MLSTKQFYRFLEESNGHAEYNDASVGDIVEGLFACALTAAYINRGEPVKELDMLKILKDVCRSGKKQKSYEIPDRTVKGIEDYILCRVNVPSLAQDVLNDIGSYKNKDLLKANIENILIFVNTDRRTVLQTKKFSDNGKPDRIEVIADGVGNQKGTKIDVFVNYNGKATKGSVSLKSRSDRIQNFDRGPVFDFDTHVGELYRKVLKLPVPRIKKQYETIMKTYKDAADNGVYKGRDDPKLTAAKLAVKEGISMVSHRIVKDMKKELKKTGYKRYLINLIMNAATKGDKSVSILDLSSMKRLRFSDKFAEKISSETFTVELLEARGKGPDKVIIMAGGQPIIQLRPVIQANVSKKTGKYSPRVIWTFETRPGINKFAKSKN
jgi:hypothetical protein